MKILFLAPQPFFQERGTPIAVRLAVEVLAARRNDKIDLLTYHEGRDLKIPNVTFYRIKPPAWVKNISPGISWKKILCDFYFLISVLKLVNKNRNHPYHLIHAVEESVFIAWLVKLIHGIPYVYDMDSSLALQLTEKWFLLRPLRPLFVLLEKIAVKGSTAVVPVCDALAIIADRHGSEDTQILRDISLLDFGDNDEEATDLRKELGLAADELLAIYVGNLESYQGIDLLIESFARALKEDIPGHLVIIGGRPDHIETYRNKCRRLGLSERVHLVGPRPVTALSGYLTQADILLSPRVRGNNTPMKIYSYLHSGKPILATSLHTHTQVLDDAVASLAKPDTADFSQALAKLFKDKELRTTIGQAGRKLAEEKYTFEVFKKRLNELYDRIGKRLEPNGQKESSLLHREVS
ncbi:MAG: glycosyltransferase [Candidatus Dadabacteria bacterium]|nr:MAG: glycosyltransferase [Candidatus Dadabacteria bacterium]